MRLFKLKTEKEHRVCLDDKAFSYLLHRYDVNHDVFMWPLILQEGIKSSEKIVHLDYSENIAKKPKCEPQPAHYSGSQSSLHCSVIHASPENVYVYHLSDVLNHDESFTKAVVLNLINEHLKNNKRIYIKSDNCREQFKCRWIFVVYREIAMSLGKEVIIYYGASGHGRGLVDGVSSFGVKTLLRREITNHVYWISAKQIIDILVGMKLGGDF